VLLAVPNVSEGNDRATIERLAGAFGALRLLDVHSDPDHGRSVLTFAGEQAQIAEGLLAGAREAVDAIDVGRHPGLHPHVGAIDVAPVVHLDAETRGAAIAAALTAAALIGGELELPVFLYGALADGRERADVRAGGLEGLKVRMLSGELSPDYGPSEPHPTAGAVLVTARPPLVAFNLDLETDDVELARAIAADLREAGGGPAGVRAIGLYLPARGRAQVSMNVHDPDAVPLAELVARVRERAAVAEAELVGLAPRAAFAGFPDDVPLRAFDPERHLLEEALKSTTGGRRT
jgi:glutamate formiminotransferase/glutamate formiminotransferase/formiminotetrahydrofolate cyclodeaminase